MLNNYLYDFLSHAQLQIYIIRAKLRNIRSSFFQGMLKSSFCGRLFGRSPSGRAFRCKSSLCCGLSPAIPNVGERVFTVLRLNLGARAVPVPASVSDHSVRLHGRSRTSGRKDKRNTSVRAVTRNEVHHRHIPCQTIAFEDERE